MDDWLLVAGCSLLVAGCRLLVDLYLSFVSGHGAYELMERSDILTLSTLGTFYVQYTPEQ